ncbi:Na+/H+ antiporter NhaC family protein [Nosocomiicoccus massiliensis]|uniref:Na+/H+ antiporter NhaC family protein n=1 Tax=Nosocomiicoccus massiliensis TaxID=1232430 RepID=A0AAF0YM71_9STAP|nr:Na+/H+ antiporter NhaC family protein [Nosocomiicoccus massiliensis]WOS96054.1 Na+/H+ antiporter NhaC family protein [Nosocomiicoccus massiliensis]
MDLILNWTYISLIPPLITLILVLLTRRVDLSLGVGIITSAIVITQGNVGEMVAKIWQTFIDLIIEDGWLNTWSAYILIFLALLGIMSAFMSMSGGARAFTSYAMTKVKTRTGALLLSGILGIIIFIDDYFSAIITPQVSKPLTDKYKVSRAKLAYVVDTTASPIAVIMPVSSWGATIMGLTAPLLIAAGLSHITPFEAFLYMIPLNFYSLSAIILMFIVILTNFDIFGMKREESRAINDGILYDKKVEDDELQVAYHSSKSALIVPLVGLVAGVLIGMIYTGIKESGSLNPIVILENNSITHSLIFGGIIGVVLSLIYYYKFTKQDENFSSRDTWIGFKTGLQAMIGPIIVLILAWMTGELISELGTGELLGQMVKDSNISAAFLPAIVFVVACIMALTTGTSWGSFGILVPIAGNIIITLEVPELLLASIAAVLAGGVFGDHCSPISDSTILSSTGSGSDHIVHVMTQIPYAVIAAVVSLVSFVVVGFTTSTGLGLLVMIGLFIALTLVIKLVYTPIQAKR